MVSISILANFHFSANKLATVWASTAHSWGVHILARIMGQSAFIQSKFREKQRKQRFWNEKTALKIFSLCSPENGSKWDWIALGNQPIPPAPKSAQIPLLATLFDWIRLIKNRFESITLSAESKLFGSAPLQKALRTAKQCLHPSYWVFWTRIWL